MSPSSAIPLPEGRVVFGGDVSASNSLSEYLKKYSKAQHQNLRVGLSLVVKHPPLVLNPAKHINIKMAADPEQPVCIMRCDHITEAEMLKNALETEGIDVTVDGAALNTTFGSISGPMISAVKLIVRREDAAESLEIIEAVKESWAAPDQDPWFCGACHEEIDGGFEICWSCGGVRDEVEGKFPTLADAIEAEDFSEVDTSNLGHNTDNPYEAPRAMADRTPKKTLGPDAVKADQRMLLGFLFSLVSMLIPVLPAIVVGLIFSDTFRRPWPLSRRAKITFWISTMILVLVHGAWFWLFFLSPAN